MIPLLARSCVVEKGYLARVVDELASREVVALCLVAQESKEELLREIGAVFAAMFGGDQHLDILFLVGDQEQDLARVGSPFFESIA